MGTSDFSSNRGERSLSIELQMQKVDGVISQKKQYRVFFTSSLTHNSCNTTQNFKLQRSERCYHVARQSVISPQRSNTLTSCLLAEKRKVAELPWTNSATRSTMLLNDGILLKEKIDNKHLENFMRSGNSISSVNPALVKKR